MSKKVGGVCRFVSIFLVDKKHKFKANSIELIKISELIRYTIDKGYFFFYDVHAWLSEDKTSTVVVIG